jgi:peptide/nickel transport system substrate-binding protein
MKRFRTLFVVLVCVAVIASACGDDDDDSGGAATETTGATTAGTSGEATTTAAGGTTTSGGTDATTATTAVADFDPAAILRYGSMQANSLDPAVQKTPCEVTQMRLLYDTLFRYDTDGKLQPMLATGYTLDSPTQLTVKLRTGVTFQDGTPFDAEAVKFVIDRALTNAESNIKSTLFMLDPGAVTVVDPTTVRFTMKKAAVGPLLFALSDRAGMMYSPTAMQAAGSSAAFTLKPVGSGMYELEGEFRPIESMSVRSWDGYWDTTTPRLGGIDMTEVKVDSLVNAIKSGEVDMVPIDSSSQLPGLEGEDDIVVQTNPSIQLRTVVLNGAEAPFDNPKVREAIAYAIDRETIAEVMTDGLSEAIYQWYPEGTEPHDPALDTLYPYDPTKAKEALAAAGMPDGFDFTAIIGDTSTSYIQQGELIQAQLKEVGINMELKKIPTAEMVPTLYPADITKPSGGAAAPWGANLTADPDNFFRARFLSDGNTNVGHDEVAGLRDALDQAAAAIDPAARSKLYAQASKLTLEGAPEGIPLFYVPAIRAYKNYVGGSVKAETRCPATLRGMYITKDKVPVEQ